MATLTTPLCTAQFLSMGTKGCARKRTGHKACEGFDSPPARLASSQSERLSVNDEGKHHAGAGKGRALPRPIQGADGQRPLDVARDEGRLPRPRPAATGEHLEPASAVRFDDVVGSSQPDPEA